MALDWEGNSAIVCGFLIDGKLAKNCVRQEIFFPPYNEIVEKIQKEDCAVEDLIEHVGLMPVQASLDAIKSLNGLGKANWIQLLEKSKAYYDAGSKLEKFGRKLTRGEEIDWSQLNMLSEKAQAGISGDFVSLDKIKASEMPFIESGWKPFDDHVGGYPEAGIIVMGGQPGVGKSYLMVKQAEKFVQKHNKKVAIFSIEMFKEELAERFKRTTSLNDEQRSRILVNELPISPNEIINKSATIENLGLVIVDFVDMLVEKDTSESEMSYIYRTMMKGAKSLHCPIILLAGVVKYEKGIPKPSHLRYTKMVEHFAWEILMLYNPSTDWIDADDKDVELLPPIKNAAYIIVWKVRGGFRKHLEDSPGAILVSFRGDKGWGEKQSRWYSLRKSL